MVKKELAVGLIKELEGFSAEAYFDVAGVSTIGYGTTIYPSGSHIGMTDVCTIEEAEEYLIDYLTQKVFPAVDIICENTKIPDKLYAAICSLIYNVGSVGKLFKKAVKEYNSNPQELAKVFRLYVHSGGKVQRGLVNRREKEIKFFQEKSWN